MTFQFRDLVLLIQDTPNTERARLLLKGRDEKTAMIDAAKADLACTGRTSDAGLLLGSFGDLENALADLKDQLGRAIEAQDKARNRGTQPSG